MTGASGGGTDPAGLSTTVGGGGQRAVRGVRVRPVSARGIVVGSSECEVYTGIAVDRPTVRRRTARERRIWNRRALDRQRLRCGRAIGSRNRGR